MIERGFEREVLSADEISQLEERARLCRGDILKMTTLAASGHPGGSMSTLDMLILVYALAHIDPSDPVRPDRDHVVVSHGHVSPAVYSALGRRGFFDVDDAIAGFRLAGSNFEGHVEHLVPGVEWNTGNLGQGLSAGCGLALSHRLFGREGRHTFVMTSDGEAAKGQIAEARRFAKKFNLAEVTVLLDYNELQISGSIHEVMPQNIAAGYEADGWQVLHAQGHDFQSLYAALRTAVRSKEPCMIMAKTVMGRGVGFMEDRYMYHGKPLSREELAKALAELEIEDDMARYEALRSKYTPPEPGKLTCPVLADLKVVPGEARVYGAKDMTDNRSAFGNALVDVAKASAGVSGSSPFAVFDCDLASSVKTDKFADAFPDSFFQSGIQEHNTATVAGALSSRGVVTFFADFGVFGVDETYNQHRLNDINWANLKVACTHVGVDVGEDGKTHHCLDYVGAMRNLFGFRVVVPADPNQTDRAVRHMAGQPGCWLLAMGRSKLPTVTAEDGTPLFSEGYTFTYGRADWVRKGTDCVLVAMGPMTNRALAVRELLTASGISAGVLNMSCPLHPDVDALRQAAETGLLVAYEDHNVRTGLGASVADVMAAQSLGGKLLRLGVDRYAPSGKPDAVFSMLGLDPEQVASKVKGFLSKE
jgi:transketolase